MRLCYEVSWFFPPYKIIWHHVSLCLQTFWKNDPRCWFILLNMIGFVISQIKTVPTLTKVTPIIVYYKRVRCWYKVFVGRKLSGLIALLETLFGNIGVTWPFHHVSKHASCFWGLEILTVYDVCDSCYWNFTRERYCTCAECWITQQSLELPGKSVIQFNETNSLFCLNS